MFIHSVILNQVVMMELKIRLGIEKKETMAVDWSGTGLSAIKVCNTVPWQEQELTATSHCEPSEI
jgi:hypothetical protein